MDWQPLLFKTETEEMFSLTSKTICLRIASISAMMSYPGSLKPSAVVISSNHFCNILCKGSSKQVVRVSRMFCLFSLTIIMESCVSSQTLSDLIMIRWGPLNWCTTYNRKTIMIMVGFFYHKNYCSWLKFNFKSI